MRREGSTHTHLREVTPRQNQSQRSHLSMQNGVGVRPRWGDWAKKVRCEGIFVPDGGGGDSGASDAMIGLGFELTRFLGGISYP